MSQNTKSVSNVYTGRAALEQLQRESNKLILLEFTGPHCGACATLKPLLHQLISKQSEKVQLVEIDATEELDLTPTVFFFKQDQMLTKLEGLQPKKRYMEAISQFS